MVHACIDSVAVEGPSGTVARGYVAVCQSLRQGPVCVGAVSYTHLDDNADGYYDDKADDDCFRCHNSRYI